MKKEILPYLFLLLLGLTGCQTTTEAPVDAAPATNPGFYDELFDEAFFAASNNPFQEIARIHALLRANAALESQLPSFLTWYLETYGQFPPQWIHMHQDEKQVSYRLTVEEQERASINISTEGNQIHLQGQLTLESEYRSRSRKLDQKLPLPSGVDPSSVFSYKHGTELIIQMDKLQDKGI